MSDLCPLVSVVVITYNSSSTITETLESVRKQTYKNIELIVSDDCSTDNTVEIVKAWMREHQTCFAGVKIIESNVNTGVAPNVNRGVRNSKGEWIKGLSGDDRLLENSIKDYIEFVSENPECNICFGRLHFWGDDKNAVKKSEEYYTHEFYPYIQANYKKQWKKIQGVLFVPGPSLFYKKSLWTKVGGLDERFPFADEYPFTYNILEAGEKIYFLDKEVYAYQIRTGSLCRDNTGMNSRVFKDQYTYIKNVHIHKVLSHGFVFIALHLKIDNYRNNLRYSSATVFVQKIAKILCLFSPYSCILKIKRILRVYKD